MRKLGPIALSILAACAAEQPQEQGKIHSYESVGNLESTIFVPCVDTSKILPFYTPADLYPAASRCAEMDRFRDAAGLFAFAYAFGVFDTKRVSDKSAHAAIGALQMRYLGTLPVPRRENIRRRLKELATPGTELFDRICSELRRVGPPQYEPAYMIQHGMEAFLGGDSTPPAEFQPDMAWASVLSDQMECL